MSVTTAERPPDGAPPASPAPLAPLHPRLGASAVRQGPLPASVTVARAFTWVLSVTAGSALFFVAFLLVLSPLQQSRAQDVLYTQFRSQLAAATAPFGVEPIAPGSPVAVIEVPSLGLRQVVVEGTSGSDLRNGPGHLRVTTLPGQIGTSAIFGRSTTYGSPFRNVPSLQPGEPIKVTTGQGSFIYKVEDVRGDGDPQPPTLGPTDGRLLLVTTDSGALGASSTVYVDARLVSQAAVTPPRFAPPIAGSENEMASDPAALLPLSLWLFLLVGVAAFTAWGVVRWGRAQTWVVAVPLFLATLWGASDSAAMLLPNLM